MKLNDEQIAALADRLIDTTSNVYLVVKEMYPKAKMRDRDWERLETIGEIFKCGECNQWRSVSLKVPHLTSTCTECEDDDES